MPIKSRNLAKDSWDFQVPVGQTTANSKIAEFKNAAGTVVASVDIEGDIACHDLTPTGALAVTGAISGSTLAIGGGTTIKKAFVATTESTDIAEIAAGALSTTEFTVAGVAVGDAAVLITPPLVGTAVPVLISHCECISGKIKLHLTNPTAGALDPAAQAYKFLVFDLT